MLRPLNPSDSPPPLAYRVPWHVDRDDEAHPRVQNIGPEAADFVRVFYDDVRHDQGPELFGQVLTAETFDLCLCAANLDSVVVTIAWFRPSDGLEYVWRFVV